MGQNSYAANKSQSGWGLRWWQERVSVKVWVWSLTGEVVREPVKEVWTEWPKPMVGLWLVTGNRAEPENISH